MNLCGKRIAFCLDCGECLGEEKPLYAKEHIKKFPNHQNFLVKTLFDPLNLDNPDDWFKKHIPLMRRNLTELKDDKDLTESHTKLLNTSTLKYGIGR